MRGHYRTDNKLVAFETKIIFIIEFSLQTRKENYSMDSQKEIIENITFFSEDCENAVEYDFPCVLDKVLIETSKTLYTIKIDSTTQCTCCNQDIGIELLGQDFQPCDKTKFYKAQLVRIVDNIFQLKRDANFHEFFRKTIKHDREFRFFKFETSAGDFYIQVSVIHNQEFPNAIEYIFDFEHLD